MANPRWPVVRKVGTKTGWIEIHTCAFCGNDLLFTKDTVRRLHTMDLTHDGMCTLLYDMAKITGVVE